MVIIMEPLEHLEHLEPIIEIKASQKNEENEFYSEGVVGQLFEEISQIFKNEAFKESPLPVLVAKPSESTTQNRDYVHELQESLKSLDNLDSIDSDFLKQIPGNAKKPLTLDDMTQDEIHKEIERQLQEIEKDPKIKLNISALTTSASLERISQQVFVEPATSAIKGPCGITLTKTQKFGLGIFSLLKKLPKPISNFIIPEFAKAKVTALASRQADSIIPSSREFVKQHSLLDSYIPDSKNATTPMTFSKSLLANPKEMHKALKNNHLIAVKAIENRTYENVEPIETVIGTMVGYKFENIKDDEGKNDILVVSGEVTPTSFVLGKAGTEDVTHLINTYVIMADGQEYGMIRSGKIDTELRADEFVTLLKSMRESIGKPDLPMRVVSQQVNSFETEAKMIQSQHGCIAQANEKLKKEGAGIELIHINIPSNRFYHMAKWMESFGSVGRSLAKLLGEPKSRELNLDSWGTYTKWVGEDLAKELELGEDPDFKEILDQLSGTTKIECQDKIKNIVPIIESIKLDLKNKNISKEQKKTRKEDLAAYNKILRSARAEMKAHLATNLTYLTQLEKKLENELYNKRDIQETQYLEERVKGLTEEKVQDPINIEKLDRFANSLEKVTLMRQVLASQIGNSEERLDRGQEGMAIQLLNDKLNITSALNCKSGLDRTGFWHAVKLGVASITKDFGPRRSFTLINEWETTTRLLNKLSANLTPEEFKTWLDSEQADVEVLKFFGEDSNKFLYTEHMNTLREKMRDVIEFRKVVLNTLERMGIPITFTSTGLPGIKWNSGMQEN